MLSVLLAGSALVNATNPDSELDHGIKSTAAEYGKISRDHQVITIRRQTPDSIAEICVVRGAARVLRVRIVDAVHFIQFDPAFKSHVVRKPLAIQQHQSLGFTQAAV